MEQEAWHVPTGTSTSPVEVLASACFLPLLQARTYPAILQELVSETVAHFGLHDVSGIQASVLAREQRSSTATPEGIAFPHGKHPEVKRVCCAIGLCPEGVPFGLLPETPVCQILVLTLSSVYVCDDHLHVLGELAKRLRRPTVRYAVLAARTHTDLQQALGLRRNDTASA